MVHSGLAASSCEVHSVKHHTNGGSTRMKASCKSAPGKCLLRHARCWEARMGDTTNLTWARVARRIRVPLGFVLAGAYLWLARPTWTSILIGLALIVTGLVIRAMASGHVQKNEQLATSGPYA